MEDVCFVLTTWQIAENYQELFSGALRERNLSPVFVCTKNLAEFYSVVQAVRCRPLPQNYHVLARNYIKFTRSYTKR